jgi:hypothetical protein
MWVSHPQLSQHLAPIGTEKPTVLLDDIALMNFALALGAQESRVRQDDPANGRGHLTGCHGSSHAPHRVAKQNRGHKPERLDEPNDIACVILVPIPVGR